jgi:hypothetical protein
MAQGQWITKNGKRIFVGGDQAGAVRAAARASAIDATRGGAHDKNPATNPPKQAKGAKQPAAPKQQKQAAPPEPPQTVGHVNQALKALGIKHPVEDLVQSVAPDKNLFPKLEVKVSANGDVTAVGSGKGKIGRNFTKGPDGEAVCVNAFLEAPKGKGTELFAKQVEGLDGSGVARIETMATRGDKENGYHTWPRLGFDADLPPELQKMLPDHLSGSSRVSDLMKSPEGRDWWKENGVGMSMSFDMKPDSHSRKVLDAYTSSKPDMGKKAGTAEAKTVSKATEKKVADKVKADPKEHVASRKLAQQKIKDAPVPTREQVAKARDELEKAKRGEGRAGGENRGGGSADRRRQRVNLFKEWGGEDKGYIVCPWSGTKMHWSRDPKDNPKGYETFERGKIFTKAQGGGYQLPNLIPESFEANRSRNDSILRKENTGKLRK